MATSALNSAMLHAAVTQAEDFVFRRLDLGSRRDVEISHVLRDGAPARCWPDPWS